MAYLTSGLDFEIDRLGGHVWPDFAAGAMAPARLHGGPEDVFSDESRHPLETHALMEPTLQDRGQGQGEVSRSNENDGWLGW